MRILRFYITVLYKQSPTLKFFSHTISASSRDCNASMQISYFFIVEAPQRKFWMGIWNIWVVNIFLVWWWRRCEIFNNKTMKTTNRNICHSAVFIQILQRLKMLASVKGNNRISSCTLSTMISTVVVAVVLQFWLFWWLAMIIWKLTLWLSGR